MHAYDPLTPLQETLRTLDGFVRAGKIRYWGLSNFTGWQLDTAVYLARALNVTGPVTIQPQYSLLAREIARTPAAAWRPTTGAAPTAPGASSTPSSRSPRTAACPWPRWRSRG